MQYITLEYFLKKFGDEDLAIRNIKGLLTVAKHLESAGKPYAILFCKFHNVHTNDPFDAVI